MYGMAAAVVIALFLLLLFANSRAAYRNGLRDGWKTHADPEDSLWDRQRLILRRYGFTVRLTTEWVRGPGIEECRDYEVGEVAHSAVCETDGHYLCGKCRWNVRRKCDHDYSFRTNSGCYVCEKCDNVSETGVRDG